MSTPFFIAKRYLQAQRKSGFLSFITIISIVGVTLGTATLIITLSILAGFEKEITEKVISFTSHIEVRGYQNLPLQNPDESMDKIRSQIQGVHNVFPFTSKECLIRSKSGVDGVLLKGIDNIAGEFQTQKYIIEGVYKAIDKNNFPAIIISKRLANRLNNTPGDTVTLFTLQQERQGLPNRSYVQQFIISGLYESGMVEFDDSYAFTSIENTKNLFGLGNSVTGYEVYLKDVGQSTVIAEEIQKLLGYPHYARSVFQIYRNLFSWISLQQKLSPIMLSLVIIVATFNIVGTLLMFVLEKTRAIGILNALGAGGAMIRRIFLFHGIFIAFTGILSGNILAFLLCWLQKEMHLISIPSEIYFMENVPILMNMENFLFVSGVAFILCIVTTFIPARLAAKLDTVTLLRLG